MFAPREKKWQLILQAERNECGLACLAMVLNYFGYVIDLNSLREFYPVSQHGENLQTLKSIAEDRHLSAKAFKLGIEDLTQLKLPAILHWDLIHFVVLTEINGNSFCIIDPAKGAVKLGIDEVGRHFTGVALELSPASSFRQESHLRKLTLLDIWRQVKDALLIKGLATTFVLSIVLLLCSVFLPFYNQLIIDRAISTGDKGLAYLLTVGFIFLLVSRSLTELVRSFLLLKVGVSVGFRFATQIYQHLLKLKYDFFARRNIGDISSRFQSLTKLQQFISSGVVAILVDGILISVTLVLMFVYSVALTIAALVPVILYVLLRTYTYGKIYQLNLEMVAASATENTFFIENIRSIMGTKLFNRETERGLVWQNSFATTVNISINLSKITTVISFLNGFIMGIGGILLILLGALAVIDEQLTLGMMFAFFQFKDQFSSRIASLVDKYFEIKLLDVHLTRLSDIVFSQEEEQSVPVTGNEAITPPAGTTEVSDDVLMRVTDISYCFSRYSGVLFQNVSFSLRQNESIAIIGRTGCGKSTLLRLLMGLILPDKGLVTIEGQSVQEIGVQEFRSRISAVLQDDTLVSGTIFENVSFFDSNPDVDRVEHAAKVACIHDEIMKFPLQYHTFVGNYGSALSGGQIQRIMIARAVYKGAKIMVLDEATSHLDMGTEKKINHELHRLQTARIIVAHRPSSIIQADRIFELTSTGLKEVTKEDFLSSVPELALAI